MLGSAVLYKRSQVREKGALIRDNGIAWNMLEDPRIFEIIEFIH